jgi:hypothetical protein
MDGVMKEYNGYLKPHVAKIVQWAKDGHSVRDIAHYLYDVEGARSPYYTWDRMSPTDQITSMAAVIRTSILKIKPTPMPKRKQKPEADWWTPEREEMLIRTERGERRP